LEKIKEITVFFPCYNEENNITGLVEQTVQILNEIAEDYQIIIVNDGSTDQTAEVAEELSARFENVELINHANNKGYGVALKTGFLNSKKDLVFYTDGDNQFDINELPKLIPLSKKYDIVSGYRIKRQDPFIRKINAGIYNIVLFLLFGLNIRDVDCAFKLYKRELFEKIDLISDGALIDAEILIKAKKLGYSIGQTGVNHYPRTAGEQTGANVNVIFRAFKEILKLRMKI